LVEAVEIPLQNNPLTVSIPERVLGWLKPVYLNAILFQQTVVSIPERVLGWLKLLTMLRIQRKHSVSIPERVLGWLKPSPNKLTNNTVYCFNP